MTHAEMDELYELYGLGVLNFETAVQIDEHIAEGCEYCLGHVRDAILFTSRISEMTEPVAPPSYLKSRVLASIQPQIRTLQPTRASGWIPGFALLAAACIGLVVFSVWSYRQTEDSRAALSHISGERDQLRAALEILTEQQTRTVRFGETGNTTHGWLFVNRDTGFVFVGSNLPQIANDRTFELWLVPAKGNPAPAGLFRSTGNGQFVLTSQTRITPSQYAAVAVSVEPRAGSAAPTTKPFLIVPLS